MDIKMLQLTNNYLEINLYAYTDIIKEEAIVTNCFSIHIVNLKSGIVNAKKLKVNIPYKKDIDKSLISLIINIYNELFHYMIRAKKKLNLSFYIILYNKMIYII